MCLQISVVADLSYIVSPPQSICWKETVWNEHHLPMHQVILFVMLLAHHSFLTAWFGWKCLKFFICHQIILYRMEIVCEVWLIHSDALSWLFVVTLENFLQVVYHRMFLTQSDHPLSVSVCGWAGVRLVRVCVCLHAHVHVKARKEICLRVV